MGEVVAIQKPIEKLVIEIRGHVHDAGRAETTCAKHQLQAGTRLNELRARVEANGDEWWSWYENQFTGYIKSRKYAEQLMKWARADDPEAARETDRANQREAMRESRERNGCHVTSDPTEVDNDIVEKALRLVEKMTSAERERFDDVYQERFR